jgi:hypothetical protein
MDTNNAVDTVTLAVRVQIELLQSHLKNASERGVAAHQRIVHGDRNGALGCIADLDALLSEAKALYGAAIALHRMTPVDPLNEDERREQAVSSSLEDIRKRFPNIEPWISPGGCFSLRLACNDGGYISIADPLDAINATMLVDDKQAPPSLEVERCGPDDEIIESARLVPLDEVVEWIDAALSRASTRKSGD